MVRPASYTAYDKYPCCAQLAHWEDFLFVRGKFITVFVRMGILFNARTRIVAINDFWLTFYQPQIIMQFMI